ncbi:putative mediator of RNA polymerase II transcription subunit 15 [Armigeres subalbatus]|uniref:putative mediator of RNA polymerase II transcription subunit 15 n=1 Tax=Armigeres subalbatus TaxID=124917 RepID=UPI002ED47273
MAKVIHNISALIGLIIALVVTQTGAIRVYWNTNTGPIVPPTTTPVPVPQPPFRDPAPVWEDQSEDVANPYPYVYILPPPSRPKYNDISLSRRQHINSTNNAQPSVVQAPSTTTAAPAGKVIENPDQNKQTAFVQNYSPNQQPSALVPQQQQFQRRQQNVVPSLAVQYVPNQGFKYYAVVPVLSEGPSKSAYLKTNDAQLGKQHERYDKPNGRYNAKLKKYKAFEKAKYVPYYMIYDVPTKQQYVSSSVSQKAVNNNFNGNASPNNL